MGLELYDHEALHAARRIYSKNRNILSHYPNSKEHNQFALRARLEMMILSELLCRICTGRSEEAVVKNLKEQYIPRGQDLICSLSCVTEEQKPGIKQMLAPTKDRTGRIVEAAFWLAGCLGLNAMVPLSFALGPTSKETISGIFISPFFDIVDLARRLDEKKITVEQVVGNLQKKDYCLQL